MKDNKNYGIIAVIAIIIIVILVFTTSSKDNMTVNKQIEDTDVEINKQNNQNIMQKNIVETAIEAGTFKTLVAAVGAAGLVETLSSEGPFTVLAPTDEAFAKLPEGTIEALLSDKAKLTSILTYHVISGKVMASDVIKLSEATTVQGSKIKIDASNGVKINGANVIATDILASNGVIHVIDTVLIPE